MRSLFNIVFIILLTGLGSAAQQNGEIEVHVVAMSVPGNSSGLVHWHASQVATVPLQLSTRYFSEGVVPEGPMMRFFAEPYDPANSEEEPPAALATVTIPKGVTKAYVVLWPSNRATGEPEWKATVFNANEWKSGSLKVLNARSDTIGVVTDDKPARVPAGSSMELSARDYAKPFPVKIFRLGQPEKLIFSSTWRISEGRRELCFIAGEGDSVLLRSLIDLGEKAR